MQGNYRNFTLQRVPETTLVMGTRGEVKILISQKSCRMQFYRPLEYQVNDGKKSHNFPMTNTLKYLDSAGGNLT